MLDCSCFVLFCDSGVVIVSFDFWFLSLRFEVAVLLAFIVFGEFAWFVFGGLFVFFCWLICVGFRCGIRICGRSSD